MKTSTFLKRVKARMLKATEGEKHTPFLGLCHYITKVAKQMARYPGMQVDCALIRIDKLLDRHTYLYAWIMHNVKHGVAIDWRRKENKLKLYHTRLAWLDWLIEDFKAKGD